MKICVTGASGFIGQALCSFLRVPGHAVRAASRSLESVSSADGLDVVAVGEVGAQTDWSAAVVGVDCVMHCAARAHVVYETESDSLTTYRAVNVAGTQRLAVQAAALGVRRFVFLSSIGVLGVHTNGRGPFFVSDAPSPIEDYALSKWEAEQALWAVSAQTGLEVVVVRLPLVYGPGVKGNMLRFLRWVASGLPLPFGAVRNQRSLVGLSNLVDLLLCCAEHPAAAGKTFLASDGQDLSTPELIRLMAEGMNRRAHLLPAPASFLKAGGSLLGKRGEIDRLVGSLQVDSGYTRVQLGWTPPVPVEDGVREMARRYAGLPGA